MVEKLHKRSDIDRRVAAGEAVKEQPRQTIRDRMTGQIISNERVAEKLPSYLIAMQSNTLIYNDIDVEAFQREVRQQVSRILDAIKDERFENASIQYQQFIDHYDTCFETPSEYELRESKLRGTDLYAVLEHHGKRLTAEMGIKQRDEESERRFNAVTEAHINLFFYMLTLNLALDNKIDSVQKQLRLKLGLLEERLRGLLREYIYADQIGRIEYGNIDGSLTLYGWVLLQQNELDTAWTIYSHDQSLKDKTSFSALHNEVMSIYHKKRYSTETPQELRDSAFLRRGLSDDRVRIALKLCYYLDQTAQIREYLDELTQDADNKETNNATVDVKTLLLARNQ
ncbi:hypothetical protein EDF88_4634 [Buttiauxella sp. BIGb0552]|uniref:hypothetical protein n=1 Tax=Buttiauxella sp. BIGb0552 TaxID=2485120 RepID=UPI001066A9D5|nr:hypothetical protein [Buttiauxella sp. BIGb0552]TDX12036.1 hypothetical protein EDF88_4634 [Buttiauxella sp. BIGb0552]